MKKSIVTKNDHTLGDKIQESKLGCGGSLLLLNNSAVDIVSVSGSLLAGDVFALETNSELAGMTAAMLDQGTAHHSKSEIEDLLESYGATISFRSSPFRIYFTVSCLKDTLDEVIGLLAEMLYDPTFPENELAVLKTRFTAMIKEDMENTRSQGTRAVTRVLFPENHPYFTTTSEEEALLTNRITRKEIESYYKKYINFSTLLVSVVGDVSPQTKAVFEKYFSKTSTTETPSLPNIPRPRLQTKNRKEVLFIPGKANADMLIGQSILLKQDGPDHLPLYLALAIFGGGGFTSRLMNEVREKRGLTYGVNATLSGVSPFSDCFLMIWATFAPKVVKVGKEVILEEYHKLLKKGVTEKELREIKKELIGLYLVSLETTPRLSGLLLANKEGGRDKQYIDDYAHKLSDVTLSEVNLAIRAHLNPETLSIVIAGTVDKDVLN